MSASPAGVGIHATAVAFGEWGVLILGPSGAGKSALALALLARASDCSQYGALIGDDRVWLQALNGRLVARGAAHMAGLIERRMAGILTAPSEAEAVVRLAVEIGDRDVSPRLPEGPESWSAEGVETPRLVLDNRRNSSDQALAVEERLRAMFS